MYRPGRYGWRILEWHMAIAAMAVRHCRRSERAEIKRDPNQDDSQARFRVLRRKRCTRSINNYSD